MSATDQVRAWPGTALTRVPFWVYQDEATYHAELRRIFEGPAWSFVCLESDLARPGDFRTTFVGEMPVIVVRAEDGAIRAFEKGSNGRGGMPPGFSKAEHGPRKLRTETLHGLVFASLSKDAPPIEAYLGEAILGRIARVLGGRRMRVLGRFVQLLPNNWKLYVENVKDTYHASLLHAFFGTFRITRLTQGGGVLVSPDGAHHASYTIDRADDRSSAAYREQGIRSERQDYKLADPRLLESVNEFGDDIRLQILTVFPTFVLQQIQNCLAVRQVVPKGPGAMELHWTYFGFEDDTPEMSRRRLRQLNLVGPAGYVSMEDGCVGGFVQRGAAAASDEVSIVNMGGEGAESDDTRATEASVRGFWKAYRRFMDC